MFTIFPQRYYDNKKKMTGPTPFFHETPLDTSELPLNTTPLTPPENWGA